jgi:hypothetical protein
VSQSRISVRLANATQLARQSPEKSLHIEFMNRMPVGNTPLLACALMEGHPGGKADPQNRPIGGSYKEEMPV